MFFDEFAKTRHFDPLLPENWYNVNRRDIISEVLQRYVIMLYNCSNNDALLQGGKGLLVYYDDSLVKALQQVYPAIGLDPQKFKVVPSMWKHDDFCNLFSTFLLLLSS